MGALQFLLLFNFYFLIGIRSTLGISKNVSVYFNYM